MDWALIGLLAAIFAVSSFVRWRYFQRRFGNASRPPAPRGDDTAPPAE